MIAGGVPSHAAHLENRCTRGQFTILNQPDNLRLIHWPVLCAVLTVMPLVAHGDKATLRLTGGCVAWGKFRSLASLALKG